MKKLLCGVASAALTLSAAPALADVFNFSYTGTGITASGTLTTTTTTTTYLGRQAYTITGITGFRNGVAINKLFAAGFDVDGQGDLTDNYLFATGPYLTDLGFAFGVTGGNLLFNPYYSGGYTEYQSNAVTSPPTGIGNFALTSFTLTRVNAGGAVPEPATWGMMVLGFGAMGYAMRRRQKVSVSYAA